MANVTVYDIWRLALPPGTQVVAGKANLMQPVSWIANVRATPPLFADVRGNEIVLLALETIEALDPHLNLASMVPRLAQAPVSAVAALGTITANAARAADGVGLPLLRLPDGSNLREVEREIKRLMSDYEAQLERRGAQLYNLLTQRSMETEDENMLLELLATHTGKGVASYAANGESRIQLATGQAQVALQSLRPTAGGDHSLLNQQIWVETIGSASQNGSYPHGYLALAGGHLDAWDRLAARQTAAAMSLVIARQQAVMAVEERLRGDFLATVLSGQPADPTVLIQRGNELGYNLKEAHIALVMSVDVLNPSTLSRLLSTAQGELARRKIPAPLLRREVSVLCMLPLTDNGPRPREIAEALRERLLHDYEAVALALGTPAGTLLEWSRSMKEAEQALHLGRQLFGSERVLSFGDLGVYRLLVLLRESSELWTFYRETLAPLVEYERKQQGELLKTLDAYFNNLGNLRATSESLHVHRNTLLYRLERIQQISKLDLGNAEEHFALWLALRAHRVLSAME